MTQQAIGMVETLGMVPAIEAADAMVKTAQVELRMVHKPDGALVCVVCEGDVASCKAAVDAAVAAASRIGTVVSHHVIPRPDTGTEGLFTSMISESMARKKARKAKRQSLNAPAEEAKPATKAASKKEEAPKPKKKS